ncbi:acetyl-CoA synthetase-like protein [Auricularia subglabra TFB-10046 SS5]|uniref:Acetyl-CoA synthetase-like protein n=1 Tax=Auricularia subglabra (strain TFB-10046 / SS5) TaxID=717982 RepID=J0D5H8_AURST|nr:acetyl-CoA synthetase-like protein [Auricularia subglabra TFB-10046 SS5]
MPENSQVVLSPCNSPKASSPAPLIPFWQRKAVFSAQYLVADVPYHSSYLNEVAEAAEKVSEVDLVAGWCWTLEPFLDLSGLRSRAKGSERGSATVTVEQGVFPSALAFLAGWAFLLHMYAEAETPDIVFGVERGARRLTSEEAMRTNEAILSKFATDDKESGAFPAADAVNKRGFDSTIYFQAGDDEQLVVRIEIKAESNALSVTFSPQVLTQPAAECVLKQLADVAVYIDANPRGTFLDTASAIHEDLQAALNSNPEQIPVPEGELLHSAFERNAPERPDRLALWFHAADGSEVKWTYGEQDKKASVLAQTIQDAAGAAGIVDAAVPLCMEKTPELYVAILGVLRAGGDLLMRAGGPVVLVSTAAERDALVADNALPTDRAVTVLAVADIIAQETDKPVVECGARPSTLAYLIWTRGTTGAPKGVPIEHSAAVQAIAALHRDIPYAANDDVRCIQFSAFTFDVSVQDFWGAPCGTLCSASRPLLLGQFPELCNVFEIIHAFSAPGNVGRPLSTISCFAVKDHRVLPRGAAGELAIGGFQNARGYLSQPDKTAAKFVAHARAGTVYLTGDVVRILHDGTIEFVGRTDDLVKLGGVRVELSEISALIAPPAPGGAWGPVATLQLSRPDRPQKVICSFVACKALAGESTVSEAAAKVAIEARERAMATLPSYMVPNVFLVVPCIPTTPSNKIDRTALARVSADVDLAAWESLLAQKAGVDSMRAIQPTARLLAAFVASDPAGGDDTEAREIHQALETFNAQWLPRIRQQLKGKIGDDQVQMAFPCLPLQEGMLSECALHHRAHWSHSCLDLDDEYDMLRTGFVQPTGDYSDDVTFIQVLYATPYVDWAELKMGDVASFASARAEQVMKDAANSVRPLWALLLLSNADGQRMLMLSAHHSIYDADTLRILLEDAVTAYQGHPLPPRPTLFSVVAKPQPFADSEPHGLPDLTGRTRPKGSKALGHISHRQATTSSREELEAAGRALGGSLGHLAQAAWAVVLGAYTEAQRVVFGETLSARRDAPALGPLLSVSPVPLDVGELATARTAVAALVKLAEESVGRRGVPVSVYRECLMRGKDKSAWDAMFVLHPETEEDDDGEAPLWRLVPNVVPLYVEHGRALNVELRKGRVELDIWADSALISPTQLALLTEQTDAVLALLANHPDVAFGTLLSQLPLQFLSYSAPTPPPSIIDAPNRHPTWWLERYAREHPNWTAAIVASHIEEDGADTTSWTYKELDDAANRAAHFILAKGIRRRTVAFCVGRTLPAYAYQLGIFKTGNCYLPVEEDLPAARKVLLVHDSDAALVFTTAEQAVNFQDVKTGVEIVVVDQQAHRAELAREPTTVPVVEYGRYAPGYLLYTSGSTGLPKGVLVSHGNLVSFIECLYELINNHCPVPPFAGKGRFLGRTSIAFYALIRARCTLAGDLRCIPLRNGDGLGATFGATTHHPRRPGTLSNRPASSIEPGHAGARRQRRFVSPPSASMSIGMRPQLHATRDQSTPYSQHTTPPNTMQPGPLNTATAPQTVRRTPDPSFTAAASLLFWRPAQCYRRGGGQSACDAANSEVPTPSVAGRAEQDQPVARCRARRRDENPPHKRAWVNMGESILKYFNTLKSGADETKNTKVIQYLADDFCACRIPFLRRLDDGSRSPASKRGSVERQLSQTTSSLEAFRNDSSQFGKSVCNTFTSNTFTSNGFMSNGTQEEPCRRTVGCGESFRAFYQLGRWGAEGRVAARRGSGRPRVSLSPADRHARGLRAGRAVLLLQHPGRIGNIEIMSDRSDETSPAERACYLRRVDCALCKTQYERTFGSLVNDRLSSRASTTRTSGCAAPTLLRASTAITRAYVDVFDFRPARTRALHRQQGQRRRVQDQYLLLVVRPIDLSSSSRRSPSTTMAYKYILNASSACCFHPDRGQTNPYDIASPGGIQGAKGLRAFKVKSPRSVFRALVLALAMLTPCVQVVDQVHVTGSCPRLGHRLHALHTCRYSAAASMKAVSPLAPDRGRIVAPATRRCYTVGGDDYPFANPVPARFRRARISLEVWFPPAVHAGLPTDPAKFKQATAEVNAYERMLKETLAKRPQTGVERVGDEEAEDHFIATVSQLSSQRTCNCENTATKLQEARHETVPTTPTSTLGPVCASAQLATSQQDQQSDGGVCIEMEVDEDLEQALERAVDGDRPSAHPTRPTLKQLWASALALTNKSNEIIVVRPHVTLAHENLVGPRQALYRTVAQPLHRARRSV